MDLADKIALVTGGARRIGKAIVLALAERGCTLVVHYHQAERAAHATTRALRNAGHEATAVRANLSREAEVERMIAHAVDRFDHIDVLVNNAAIFFRTPIDTLDFDDWQRVMDVNLNGSFLCAHAVGLRMKAWGWGHIVNIADVAGQNPWADYVPYSVSQAGLLALSQGLAVELAPEVMVNAVVPGPVLFDAETPADVRRREIGKTLLKRAGTPADVARLVVFVAESDYSTGAVFSVDGGRGLT